MCSTSTALVPVRLDVVRHRGGTVNIAVHTAEYLRVKVAWKRRIFRAHPDQGGSPARLRELLQQRTAWETAETAWYGQFGLPLPDARSTDPALVASDTAQQIIQDVL